MLYNKNESPASTINGQNKQGKKQIAVPMGNVYVQTVFKLFTRYLIEEVTGQGITADIRLAALLKEARTLHSVERIKMIDDAKIANPGLCWFGKRNEANTELVFVS